jgi:hypothetical protein
MAEERKRDYHELIPIAISKISVQDCDNAITHVKKLFKLM